MSAAGSGTQARKPGPSGQFHLRDLVKGHRAPKVGRVWEARRAEPVKEGSAGNPEGKGRAGASKALVSGPLEVVQSGERKGRRGALLGIL